MRPEQTLKLLWSDDRRPVGRSGVTVADYVTAATELLDQHGAEGLSIRAVTGQLGVRTMAAYALGDKDDLVALVVDRAFRDLYPDGDPPPEAWRPALRHVAAVNRRLGLARPWIAELQPVRSLMGPYEMRKREHELAAIEATPLDDVEKDQVLTQLLLLVWGMTGAEASLRRERLASGLSDPEWWSAVLPSLAPVVDAQTLPLATRIGSAAQQARRGEFWGDRSFDFGLECFLDGIEALIARRS